jgi:hypothetical protein
MAAPATINLFPKQTPIITDPEQGYRVFTVVRSEGIDLPGCTSVTEVRLNGQVIPPYVDEKVLDDLTFQNRSPVRLPLWQLIHGENGPMLVRSMKSNDGAWQVGSTVSIMGTWNDGTDELDSMSVAELKQRAIDAGVPLPSGYSTKAVLLTAIRAHLAK